MSTLALSANGGDAENVDAADTYVSSAQTEPTYAALPEIDDGAGSTVAVGTEIRFEATGGSVIVILDADGRRVGVVPGRGQAVVVAEAGAQESEPDFWRFQLLPQSPAAFIADANGTNNEVEINAILDILEDFGLMQAE